MIITPGNISQRNKTWVLWVALMLFGIMPIMVMPIAFYGEINHVTNENGINILHKETQKNWRAYIFGVIGIVNIIVLSRNIAHRSINAQSA
jgi:hypothetical protein